MGLMRSLARATVTGSSGIATPEQWVVDWFRGGQETASGVRVDEETALHYGPFFAGVRVVAEDIASLPLPLYERLQPRGKQRATGHPLYALLHDAPNELMGSMQLRETLQGHVMTWGDGMAYIVRDGAGRISELWPLRPDRVTPEVRRNGVGRMEVTYRYHDEANGIHARLLRDEVLHIAGLGFDGVRGYSVVHMARQALGLGLATEYYGARFFGNGSRPGGVLQSPGRLSSEARERLKTDWENLHKGLDRSQRVAILEEGLTWQQVGIPPEDAQFLETRKLQVTEAARWLRLPPHKIGDLERATFSNIESQQLDYVTTALRSWLVRWEQAISRRLLSDSERGRYFAEHLVDGLLRGDTTSRFQAYSVARQWGWMSANDVREKENENPVEGGDTYLVPLNMVPADSVGQAPRAARELRGRSTEGRRRIAESWKSKMIEADQRTAKLEQAEVSSLVRRHLERKRSVSAFVAAAQSLYAEDGLVADRATKAWNPIAAGLMAEVASDAAADVGHEDEVDLSRFASSYVTSHVGYRLSSSFGQLRAAADGAATQEDAAAAVLARVGEWVRSRPERTARWESVQAPAAASRETWRAAGVRRLHWTTTGDDDCPYCTALAGRVVGIDEQFMSKGEQIDGPGGEALEVQRGTFHPPAHPGCDCVIEPA